MEPQADVAPEMALTAYRFPESAKPKGPGPAGKLKLKSNVVAPAVAANAKAARNMVPASLVIFS